MSSFKAVPIPQRMRHLPLDRRGYPIFYVAMRDASGAPVFTANDQSKVDHCTRNDCCHVCGGPLFRGRWFAGGPMSAFHSHGAYNDGPMHTECIHYALQVCPYLALASYRGSIAKQQGQQLAKEGVTVVETTMLAGQPPVFVAVMSIGHDLIRQPFPLPVNFKPRQPYRVVEYWRHGRQITEEEAYPLIAEYVEKAADAEQLQPTITFGERKPKLTFGTLHEKAMADAKRRLALLAVEFGYRKCEAGDSLEEALVQASEFFKSST